MWFKKLVRQVVLICIVAAGTLALWIVYVPAAQPWLEKAGIYDALGIEPAQATEAAGGGRGWGGGGPTTVVVAEVQQGRLNDSVTAIGDGRAARSVTVKAEATGRITEIGFGSGRYVEEGALLFRFDDAAETIALDRAQLMLDDASAAAERVRRLEDAGTVSVVATREAELELRTAELAVRQAEFDLSQRTVRAPISGWIGLLELEVGDRVSSQDRLAVITDRSEILIDFRVPERVLPRVEPGMEFRARPLALNDVELTGEISAIDNVIDRASRTMRVLGRLANEGDRLRDGMALSVTLSFPGEAYPSVDPLAVQWSSEGAFVWAVRDDRVERVPVEIRQRNSRSVLVEAALEPGETVVIEGVQTLRPGAEVTVQHDAATAATGAPDRSRL